ncbi:hypothetical protein [Streptomyces sp. NPDC096033]|uniref:nSTAND1 domain-containing NTPase n=1 Tax=Streptomyces sp. NPDC096033 TaxID=3366071 RepID=UPI00381DC852
MAGPGRAAGLPYRGLEPFNEEHAHWFEGRQDAVRQVLTNLARQQRLTLLLGPSGSGKSSLIRAGVLPALAAGELPGSDRWLPVLARPMRDLPAELERAGLPDAAQTARGGRARPGPSGRDAPAADWPRHTAAGPLRGRAVHGDQRPQRLRQHLRRRPARR